MNSSLSRIGIDSTPVYQKNILVSKPSQPTARSIEEIAKQAIQAIKDQATRTIQEIGTQAKLTIKEIKPKLELFFQEKTNSCHQEAQECSIKWIERFRLFTDPAQIDKFNKQNFGVFAANCHPHANVEKCSMGRDLTSWLFFADDHHERCEDANELAFQFTDYKKVINDPTKAPKKVISEVTTETIVQNNLLCALADITKRIDNVCTPSWKERFKKDFFNYLTSTQWELENRTQRRMPRIDEYKRQRPDTSATIVMHDFIEMVEGFDIPEAVFNNPYFKRMRVLGVNGTNWENDLLSMKKEAEQAIRANMPNWKNAIESAKNETDILSVKEKAEQAIKEGHEVVHNLVSIIKSNDKISYQEAFRRAADQLLQDVREFYESAKQVPDFGQDTENVRRYIEGVKEWDSAHHFWAITAARYNEEPS